MNLAGRATVGVMTMTRGWTRPVPADFEATFVALGREQCAEHYRCRKAVISDWLDLAGKAKLIEARAEYVRRQRERLPQPRSIAAQIHDQRHVPPALARHAAQFLRCVRNGGWIVSLASNGDWWVGMRRRSPADLVDFAVAKGFDPETADLQLEGEGG
jgi:hypothetical protein